MGRLGQRFKEGRRSMNFPWNSVTRPEFLHESFMLLRTQVTKFKGLVELAKVFAVNLPKGHFSRAPIHSRKRKVF